MLSRDAGVLADIDFCSSFLRTRYSIIWRAFASFLTTANESPASGVPFIPRTSTGSPGIASCTCSPLSLIRARTRPHSEPTTKMSPVLRVPFWTRIVATEPLPCTIFASITDPWASRLGLALRSRISDCKKIASSSLSRFIFFLAETSTHKTSPPMSSMITSWRSRSCLALFTSASGRSILLIAMIIGTSAALAWLMASIVWGIIESFAAITITTISVTFAPRERISVNAAWPGVSRNVILLSLASVIW